MRLVRNGGAGESAKNRPRRTGRITAIYSIHLYAKILLSHGPFSVLPQISRIFAISADARGKSGDPASSVMQFIAGNRQYPDLFCITGNA